MRNAKINKKRKNLKKLKGFTMVEILAVLVILAILLTIAVPNVINAMNASKRRALVNVANNIILEAQKRYTSDIETYGNYLSQYEGDLEIIYDINQDLGFSKDHSVKGYVTYLLWEENPYPEESYGNVQPYSYFLFIYTDEYLISKMCDGAPYFVEEKDRTVNLDDLQSRNSDTDQKINMMNKETYGIINSYQKCMDIDMDTIDGSYVDGKTLKHLGHWEGDTVYFDNTSRIYRYRETNAPAQCGFSSPEDVIRVVQEELARRRG